MGFNDDDELFGDDPDALLDEVLGGEEDIEKISRRRDVGGVEGSVYPQIEDFRRPLLVHDELEDHVDRMAKAGVGPNGEVLDEIYQLARVKSLKQAEVAQKAPFISSAPQSALGAQLGQQITVSANGVPNNPTIFPVAYWQGEDHDTRPVSVTLVANPPGAFAPVSPSTTIYRPFAVIQFGTRGALATAVVDIPLNGGTQLTVSGSSVTVSVGMEAPGVYKAAFALVNQITPLVAILSLGADMTTPGVGTVPQLNLAAMLSFGQIKKNAPAIKTRYVDNLADGGAVGFAIPPFANELLPVIAAVHGSTQTQGKFNIAFDDIFGNSIGVQQITSGLMTGSIPIPADAAICIFTNVTGGGNAVDARLMFGMNF